MHQPGLLQWTDKAGKTTTIGVDVLESFEDNQEFEVPTAPVEKGGDVADHVIDKARQISISILQTETPIHAIDGFDFKPLKIEPRASLFEPGGYLALTTAVTGAIGGLLGKSDNIPTEVNVLQGPNNGRGLDVLDAVLNAAFAHALCTLTARFGTTDREVRIIKNLLIKNVGHSVTASDSRATRFKVDLEPLRTVTTAQATIPKPQDERMKGSKNKGEAPKKVLSDAEKKAQAKSIAANLLDGNLSGIL